ncbi:MAG: LicD family protein [Lachnospiraceae bacterium]|nr:LicD family protein [Lachnospiraceae bacterium]
MLQFPEDFFKSEIRTEHMVNETSKRMWAAQMEVLQRIDEICKRHNLTYYAYWGTLLGAVRHQGFIPWDDDMDIAMPGEDYIKFLSVAREELPQEYWILNMYTSNDWFEYFTKITNGKSIDLSCRRSIEHHGCPLAMGIDIFPLYYIPRDEEIAENIRKILSFIQQLEGIVIHREEHPETEEEKQQYDLEMAENLVELERITGYKFVSDRPLRTQLLVLFDQISRIGTAEDSDYLTTFYHYARNKDKAVDKKWLKLIQIPFENIMINAPEDYDSVLRKSYGNYQVIRKINSLETHNAEKHQTHYMGEHLELVCLREQNKGKDLDETMRDLTEEEKKGISYAEAKKELPIDWINMIYVPDDNGNFVKKKVILYYTGIEAMLLSSGHVIQKIKNVLETFKMTEDVVLWWMPFQPKGEHMDLLKYYVPELLKDYAELINQFREQGWGICDESGNVTRAMMFSDAYYGDKGVIAPTYKRTGKPMMYQDYQILS